jgi:hypothetical protein
MSKEKEPIDNLNDCDCNATKEYYTEMHCADGSVIKIKQDDNVSEIVMKEEIDE